MAINSNHILEELNGERCIIVEKNMSAERVAFLKPLLEYNTLKVIVVPSAAPKTTTPPPSTDTIDDLVSKPSEPEPPQTFTMGVTNMLFNPINAVYGRLLRTTDGHIVTPAYWQQKETESNDEVPYFENKQV